MPRFDKYQFDAILERCHGTLLAFSCKQRGLCPPCGERRMSQTSANLVDHVIAHAPMR